MIFGFAIPGLKIFGLIYFKEVFALYVQLFVSHVSKWADYMSDANDERQTQPPAVVQRTFQLFKTSSHRTTVTPGLLESKR